VPFGPEGLVIPWYVPVPRQGRASVTTADVLEPVSRALGSPPTGLARDKHGIDVFPAEIFNGTISWHPDQISAWDAQHGMEPSPDVMGVFSKYVEGGKHSIFHALVEHPPVPTPFSSCSVVFQRADIFFTQQSPGRQDLFLQVQFHNAHSETEFVNLAPTGVLHVSFAADSIWYPLELTRFSEEPSSVVLNFVTSNPLEAGHLPEPFHIQKRSRMRDGVHRYFITHATAILDGGADIPDLNISL